jgi:hypothetical protein
MIPSKFKNDVFQVIPLGGASPIKSCHSNTINISPKGCISSREEVLLEEFLPACKTPCLFRTVQYSSVAAAQHLYNVRLTIRLVQMPSRTNSFSIRYYTISMILGTVALAYGSVPLYKMV